MRNGELRHRITVLSLVEVIDPDTGYRSETWTPRLINEPAQWLAGPGREYLASEATRATVSGRFVIRWSPGAALIKASDRVEWDGRLMQVQAPPLPDETARRELTLMVGDLDGT